MIDDALPLTGQAEQLLLQVEQILGRVVTLEDLALLRRAAVARAHVRSRADHQADPVAHPEPFPIEEAVDDLLRDADEIVGHPLSPAELATLARRNHEVAVRLCHRAGVVPPTIARTVARIVEHLRNVFEPGGEFVLLLRSALARTAGRTHGPELALLRAIDDAFTEQLRAEIARVGGEPARSYEVDHPADPGEAPAPQVVVPATPERLVDDLLAGTAAALGEPLSSAQVGELAWVHTRMALLLRQKAGPAALQPPPGRSVPEQLERALAACSLPLPAEQLAHPSGLAGAWMLLASGERGLDQSDGPSLALREHALDCLSAYRLLRRACEGPTDPQLRVLLSALSQTLGAVFLRRDDAPTPSPPEAEP